MGTDSDTINSSTIQFVPLYSLVNNKKHPTKRKLSLPNFQSLSSTLIFNEKENQTKGIVQKITTKPSTKVKIQQEKFDTSKKGCTKVSIGRQLLCELWWKNCPNVCNAHLPTSHRVCTEYCKVVRQNVQSLSRKIIVVNSNDCDIVSNNDENELLSNSRNKNMETQLRRQQHQHLNDVLAIHPECKCKSLVWYDNIYDDVHDDDADDKNYCKTPKTTNFLIGIGNDPHVPWMIFQVQIPMQFFLPQIPLPSCTNTSTTAPTTITTDSTSCHLNGNSKNIVNIVTPSTKQVQGQNVCTTSRGAIVHRIKNTNKRRVLSSSPSLLMSPLSLMSTRTTIKPVNKEIKDRGESSDSKTSVRYQESETHLQTPKQKHPIKEIIVTGVSYYNSNKRNTMLIKDKRFQSSTIKSSRSKRKIDFASRTERRERLRRRIFAESSSSTGSIDRQHNDDHLNQFFTSNSQQQHHKESNDNDNSDAVKDRKRNVDDEDNDNDSYNFMHRRTLKQRQKEIRLQQQIQRQQKRELRQQQQRKQKQQEQQNDDTSHAQCQQEHVEQEQQQATDLDANEKTASTPNVQCTEHIHVRDNGEGEIESNKSINVSNTTGIVGYKQNETKNDVDSYAIDKAEAAYALLSLTGILTTTSNNQSNQLVDSSQHHHANRNTNGVHDLQQLECQSDIVLLPFTQCDDECNQRAKIHQGHLYSFCLQLDEENSVSAIDEFKNSMILPNNCYHKHNSVDSSYSTFLASDPTEDPPTPKIYSTTAITTTTTNYNGEEPIEGMTSAKHCHNSIDSTLLANNPLAGEYQEKIHDDKIEETRLHTVQQESLVDHCVIEGTTKQSTDIQIQALPQGTTSTIQKKRKLIHESVTPHSHPAVCSLPVIPKTCSGNDWNITVADSKINTLHNQECRQGVAYMQSTSTNNTSMIETVILNSKMNCNVQQERLQDDFPRSCPLLYNDLVSADGDKSKMYVKETNDEPIQHQSAPAGINVQLHDSTSKEVQNVHSFVLYTTEKGVMNNDVYKESQGRWESSILSLPFGIQSNLGQTEQASATSVCEAFEGEHQSSRTFHSCNDNTQVTDLKIQDWLELDSMNQTMQQQNESTFRSTMIQLIIAKNQNNSDNCSTSRLWLPALFNLETKIV